LILTRVGTVKRGDGRYYEAEAFQPDYTIFQANLPRPKGLVKLRRVEGNSSDWSAKELLCCPSVFLFGENALPERRYKMDKIVSTLVILLTVLIIILLLNASQGILQGW
jgi:hypothetical protein